MSVTGYTSAASYKAWGLFGTVLGEATKVGDLKKTDPTRTKISQAALSLFALIGCVPTGGMALGAFFADRGATRISGESSTALCSVQQLRDCLNQHENSLKRYKTEAFNLSISGQKYNAQEVQELQRSYQITKGDFEPALKAQVKNVQSLMEEIQGAKAQLSDRNYPSCFKDAPELSAQLTRVLKMTDMMFAEEHLKQLAKPSATE